MANHSIILILALNDLNKYDVYHNNVNDVFMFYMMTRSVMKEHVPSVKDFFEVIVQSFSDVDFQRHFRLSCPFFHEIVQEIGPIISKENRLSGKKPVIIEKQIMICLWYLPNNSSLREISVLFGISTFTVYHFVHIVCKALCSIRSGWFHGQMFIGNKKFRISLNWSVKYLELQVSLTEHT